MKSKNEEMLSITFLLLLLSPYPAESFIISSVLTVVNFAYQAYQIVNDAHDTYNKFAPATTLDDVLNQAKKVESKIDQLGAKLSDQISNAVNSIVTQIDDRNNMQSYAGEIQFADYQLRQRTLEYYQVFSEVMGGMSSSVRKCPPSGGWIRDQNFHELTRYKSSYFVNDKALHEDGICSANYEEPSLQFYPANCDENLGCRNETQCYGELLRCRTTTATAVAVCELKPWDKRYEFVRTDVDEGGDGNDVMTECNGEYVLITSQEECEIRQCECIEDGYKSYSLRTFSFRGQLPDVQDRKVVTGAKFVVKENMLHIQIQQGKLMPEGLIDLSSIEWKPIEEIKYDREETLRQEKLIYQVRDNDGNDYEMKESIDFGTLKGEEAAIYIDELFAPNAYVITGVRFNHPSTEGEINQNSIQLEIHVSPVDLDSGKIEETDDDSPVWLTPNDMIGQHPEYGKERTELKWEEPSDPLLEEDSFLPRSSPNFYVHVDNTNDEFDPGQTVIPFFDGQEVAGKPPFSIDGIGWYLQSTREGGGGFISFRLWPLNPIKNLPIRKLDKSDKLEPLEEFGGCNTNLPK